LVSGKNDRSCTDVFSATPRSKMKLVAKMLKAICPGEQGCRPAKGQPNHPSPTGDKTA